MEAKFLSSCALVRPGDWLGVVHLTSPAAIGAQFVPLDATLMPKIDDAIGGNGQAIGLNATFDMTFTYPYILLMAGYIFSGNPFRLHVGLLSYIPDFDPAPKRNEKFGYCELDLV